MHGPRLGEHFGIGVTGHLAIDLGPPGSVHLTRLLGTLEGVRRVPDVRPESAYSIVVQMRALEFHELRVSGRQTHRGLVPADAVSVVHLGDGPITSMSGTFDAMQLHVPDTVLSVLAERDGLGRSARLVRERDRPDAVATAIARLLLPALHRPEPAQRLFVEHLTWAFLAHAARSYAGQAVRRSTLAAWQECRAKEVMHARLATALSTAEISAECRLSPGHFSSAFRRTTGQTPHRYLAGLRVREAQRLLLATDLPLVDVGARCGLGEQSYFTRVFSRLVGTTPGEWRRRHRGTAAPSQG